MTENPFFAAGMERLRQNDLLAAEGLFRASIANHPDHASSYNNLALIHGRLGHKEAALTMYRIAHRLDPTNAHYCGGIGKALWDLERYAAALPWCELATTLNPQLASPWHNIGACQYAMGNPFLALAAYETALRLDHVPPDTAWDHSWALLATGDWHRGFEQYELRWERIPKGPIWDSGIPEWQGEDLTGKHIVVHHEQGYGDTLNFVRFVPRLRDRGATVTMAVPSALYRTMLGLLGIDGLILLDPRVPFDAAETAFDFHSPVISVMRWLGITPNDVTGQPYIVAPHPPEWSLSHDQFHVGLVWSAATTALPASEIKSIDPTLFCQLAEISGVVLHGLQKNDGLDDLDLTGMRPLIRDHSGQIKDFFYLAGIMQAMDLVVSVDTGPLHLAGAIGVDCIGLLPYARCWRWPRGDKHVTPWYDKMHLEAQPRPRDWKSVIERVETIIRDRIIDGRGRAVPVPGRRNLRVVAGS